MDVVFRSAVKMFFVLSFWRVLPLWTRFIILNVIHAAFAWSALMGVSYRKSSYFRVPGRHQRRKVYTRPCATWNKETAWATGFSIQGLFQIYSNRFTDEPAKRRPLVQSQQRRDGSTFVDSIFMQQVVPDTERTNTPSIYDSIFKIIPSSNTFKLRIKRQNITW
jgi:hypothetical protein